MVATNRIDFSYIPEAQQASSDLQSLSPTQRQRLSVLLDRYLVCLENGDSVVPDTFTAQDPDLRPAFQAYLQKLNDLYGMVSDSSKNKTVGPDAAINRRLGEFQIIRTIGRGGMGMVYEALQLSLSRRVALKLLPIASTLDATQIARFQNEAHAAGLLQHPCIVPVHSVGKDQGIHYYAMQLIDGVSMDRWIAAHAEPTADSREAFSSSDSETTSPPWQTVVNWAAQIADALHAAHEAGVIHRDVKPSNLMLDTGGQIWITDFGLARCQSNLSLTGSRDLLGTMRYMSPEQAAGQSALVDGRCDVYSLAATLYEMLTLRPAFDGETAAEILKQIEHGETQSLRRMRSDLPRDLETVIAKAMSTQRDARYQTAAELADDLRRVVAGEATVARPPTAIDHCFRLAARHRTVVALTCGFILIGSAGLAAAAWSFASLKQSAEASAVQSKQNASLARGAVDRLGSQMAELLADIPAAESVRQRLLAETLDYYQTFAVAAVSDPSLRQDLAVTHAKIGALQIELGDTEKAIPSLRHAERLYAELSAEHPQNVRRKLDWCTSQSNLALSLQRLGDLEGAARLFSSAIENQRDVLRRVTDDDGSSANRVSRESAGLSLGTTLNNLGLLLSQANAPDEAEATYLEAMEILQAPVKDSSNLGGRQSTLAAVRANLCALLADRSPQRAIRFGSEAIAAQSAALSDAPGDPKSATQIVLTLHSLGSAQIQNRQPAASIQSFRRAIEIGEQLVARWPDQPALRRDLVISLNHLGLAYSNADRLVEARESFTRALRNERAIADAFSNDPEIQSLLGGVLNNLGFTQQQLGDRVAAAKCFREAIEAQATSVRLAPKVRRYREYLQKHRENYRSTTLAKTAS